MAINPINISRVTTTLKSGALLGSLQRNSLDSFLQQARISSGRQFVSPSEDPSRAARALSLSEVLEQQGQLITNIRHASNALDATDAAMAEVSRLITDAEAVASQNIGTLASSEEREAAAEVVKSIREQLVAVGNRSFDGRFIFAGRNTNLQPFVSALGGVTYRGDTGDVFARTDLDELSPINLTGDVLFGALTATTPSVNLDPIISSDTRLEDLIGAFATGISKGEFQIVEDNGTAVTVDLSSADSVGDVVEAINEAATAAGAGFTASLGSSGLVITPGGSAVTVRDISTGTTARDLGIVTQTATTAPINGTDLGVLLSTTTPIANLVGGTGIDLSGGLLITNGDFSATVDLSQAETVQDILNAINASGLSVVAQINADRNGIEVVNTVSGLTMTVGENGGTTATELGIRSLHEQTTLASLNQGQGVRTSTGVTDIAITAKNGASFEVNLDGAVTIQDVLDLINAAAAAAGVAITADLAPVGNGIRLNDASGGSGAIIVERANVSFALDDLGLGGRADDPATTFVGQDVAGVKIQGVIAALFDLERALLNDDSQAITLAVEDVDAHLVEFNRARGLVGARAAAMQDRLTQTESAAFATRSFLSDVQDLDFTEAITKFQQAQTTLQATLLTGSQVLNTSLLDFLGP